MWHAIIATIYKYNKDRKFTNRIDYGVMALFGLTYLIFFAVFIAKTKYTVGQRIYKITL